MNWKRYVANGGRLDRRDRVRLMGQIMLTRLQRTSMRWRDRIGLGDRALLSVVPERIQVPDSRLAAEAMTHVQALSPPWLFNHCMRTWLWSQILAQARGVRHDPELLFVAGALHDLGLTDAHNGHLAGCNCFAVEGATAAHEFVMARRADPAWADQVRAAITLHLDIRVSARQGVEAHFLNAGAAMDVVGAGLRQLEPMVIAGVVARYPWLEFAQAMAATLTRQTEQRPESRAAFLDELGFTDMIRAVRRQ